MAEYIDKKDLIDFIKDTRWQLPHDSKDFFTRDYMLLNFEQIVSQIHTADVVEVVRCKDCKYGEVDDADFPDQYLCHHSGDNWNNGNHFCAFGTPKERGGEK